MAHKLKSSLIILKAVLWVVKIISYNIISSSMGNKILLKQIMLQIRIKCLKCHRVKQWVRRIIIRVIKSKLTNFHKTLKTKCKLNNSNSNYIKVWEIFHLLKGPLKAASQFRILDNSNNKLSHSKSLNKHFKKILLRIWQCLGWFLKKKI